KTISVLSQIIQRQPLFEVFTSSTCPPCKPGNENYHSIVDVKPASEFVSIKYQQDFPGQGDTYATTESLNRRFFYAISSIPRMEIDGGWDENANVFTNQLYNDAKDVPAFYEMSGTYLINNKTVTAAVNYKPLVTSNSMKLYVAVLEDTTIKNVKNNGEVRFMSVMKKMLPNEFGTVINTPVNTPATLNFNYTFNGNYRLPANAGSP